MPARRAPRRLADAFMVAGLLLFILGTLDLTYNPQPVIPRPPRLSDRCQHTQASPVYATDSRGYVCRTPQLVAGCCPSRARYSCRACTRGCCADYEICVSCCMAPHHSQVRDVGRKALARYALRGSFQVCAAVCRSGSQSVVHENAYRHRRHHCWQGGPEFDPKLHRGLFDFAVPLK